MKKNFSLLLIFLGMFLFVSVTSCATSLQGQKAYLYSLKEFTLTVKKYNAYYDLASPTLKQRWKEEIDPVIFNANDALDIWGIAMASGTVTNEQERYEALKNELLRLLITNKIIEVKEE